MSLGTQLRCFYHTTVIRFRFSLNCSPSIHWRAAFMPLQCTKFDRPQTPHGLDS